MLTLLVLGPVDVILYDSAEPAMGIASDEGFGVLSSVRPMEGFAIASSIGLGVSPSIKVVEGRGDVLLGVVGDEVVSSSDFNSSKLEEFTSFSIFTEENGRMAALMGTDVVAVGESSKLKAAGAMGRRVGD